MDGRLNTEAQRNCSFKCSEINIIYKAKSLLANVLKQNQDFIKEEHCGVLFYFDQKYVKMTRIYLDFMEEPLHYYKMCSRILSFVLIITKCGIDFDARFYYILQRYYIMLHYML